MSLLNTVLGQVSENATVQNLAAKVGLSPEQAEQAIAALGQAHTQPGDTVETASQNTGIPTDKLSQIVHTLVARCCRHLASSPRLIPPSPDNRGSA